ncbi:hypothetical protein ACVW00_002836 [Marmoricola sp. URHA0025 HA25]
MNTHTLDDRIAALAPAPEALDQEWARATLADILADSPPRPLGLRNSRRLAAIGVAGVITLGTGVAAAGFGSIDAVKDTLLGFASQPNTTGNGIGTLHTPQLVAEFRRSNGKLFAFWIATSSSGKVCFAYSDASWDGEGTPTAKQLEYGCGIDVSDPSDPDRVIPLERPDQLGGFFKDEEPILYGVSPYPDSAEVQVRGVGVDLTLPVRADSHGYGTSLPDAGGADSLTLTFLDSAGRTLGTRTVVAPVG